MHMYMYMYMYIHTCIIELVDSISRDGPDMALYVIQNKNVNNSEQKNFKDFSLIYIHIAIVP